MIDQFSRTRLLLGEDAIEILHRSHVAIFGIGGVGGYVCEALVRSGVGAFDLIDDDAVSLTNLNRQIIATHETIGRPKVDVMKERMLSIAPDVRVRVYKSFVLPENIGSFPFGDYDHIADCVDTVAAKLALIERAGALNIPIISAMGAGNKLDPSRFHLSDISKTHTCPLARVMRRELKKRNIDHLQVVWSDEEPLQPHDVAETERPAAGRRSVPGSTAFTPAAAGLLMAYGIIEGLISDSKG